MTRITASQARNGFADLINRVAYRGEHIVLHRRGKNIAAIIPMEELELLEKMLQTAEDESDRADIRKAKQEVAREGTIPWEKVKKNLKL